MRRPRADREEKRVTHGRDMKERVTAYRRRSRHGQAGLSWPLSGGYAYRSTKAAPECQWTTGATNEKKQFDPNNPNQRGL
jgi:hypothetical protein